MPAEGFQPGDQFRVVPVGMLDRGPQVVDHQGARHAAQGMEGILQAGDEVFGGLLVDGLAVSFT